MALRPRGREDRDSARNLSPGQFIGEIRRTAAVRGISFREVIDLTEGEIPLHTHAEAHFCFVLRGLYTTSAAGVDGPCAASTLLYNPPGTTHRDRFHTRGGRFFAVSIGDPVLAQVRNYAPPIDHAAGLHDGEAVRIVRRLHGELQTLDAVSPLAMEGLTLELLSRLSRQPAQERMAPRWLKLAAELLRDELVEPLSLGGIAAAVGVHPVHLTRTFKRHFHCTPGEYQRQQRVERASALLRTRGSSLAEVALASGFSDQSQLTRTFKRVTGWTPGEYRRLHE